ncbi:hypothetical protein Tiera_017 [Polaromonas phage Tiera]|nr:hypothetical protein Tiera_017 [Polaromonas phage Tiera]
MIPLALIGAVAQIAPIVTKWLDAGQTVQEVADKASSIAKVVTGQDTDEGAIDALQANPELALQFKSKLIDQEMEDEKLYQADKANARARDIVLQATPGGNVRANWLVAYALLLIASILIVLVSGVEIDEYVKTTISLILGMFLNELKNIYSFEFGTTRRSRAKSDVMEKTDGNS